MVATRFKSQSFEVHTESHGPAMLVVAQTFYPPWRASIDGRPARLWRANYAFQALEVPAGAHIVRIAYQDRVFLAGVGCSGLGILICCGFWVRAAKRLRAPSPIRAPAYGN